MTQKNKPAKWDSALKIVKALARISVRNMGYTEERNGLLMLPFFNQAPALAHQRARRFLKYRGGKE